MNSMGILTIGAVLLCTLLSISANPTTKGCAYYNPLLRCIQAKPRQCDPSRRCYSGDLCCPYECEGTRCQKNVCPAYNMAVRCKKPNDKNCIDSKQCGAGQLCCQYECEGTKCYNPDCYLKPKVGPCEALIPSWYFDPADQYCKEFNYGGCQGNKNRFETEQQCRTKCHARERLECGPVCDEVCKYGHVLDERGCPTCPCNQCPPVPDPKPEICSRARFASDCTDNSNCTTAGQVCCPNQCGVPRCTNLSERPGQCPVPPKDTFSTCLESCENDFSCNSTAKCCSMGCQRLCAEAQFSDKCPVVNRNTPCLRKDDDFCFTDSDCAAPTSTCCPTQCNGTRCI